MNKNKLVIIGVAVIVLVSGTAQFLSVRSAVPQTIQTAASAGEQNANTTTAPVIPVTDTNKDTKNPVTHPLPLADGDTIASWDFKGAYTGNAELVAKAESEIKRLSVLMETDTSSAMILSVGIANQYELLGDGKKQYEYLERAIKADVNVTSGLPWHNLGVLMERLGALETARVAYEKSTVIQPELKQWHYSYIEFLTSRTRDDTVHIEKAFAFAEKNTGKTPYLAELRTEWQKP